MTGSQVHASSEAVLLIDEAWYAHVGRGRPAGEGQYRGADPVWDITSSVGVYHGAPVPGEAIFEYNPPDFREDFPVQRGSIAAYDGHVELLRDPCPLLDSNSGRNIITVLMHGGQDLYAMMARMVFALTGKKFDLAL